MSFAILLRSIYRSQALLGLLACAVMPVVRASELTWTVTSSTSFVAPAALHDGSYLAARRDNNLGTTAITRFSARGDLLWSLSYPGVSQPFPAAEQISSIAELADGGVVLAGGYANGCIRGFLCHNNAALVKIDATGAVIWRRWMEVGYSVVHAVHPTNDGGFVAAGDEALGGSPFIAKFTADGDVSWLHWFGSSGQAYSVEDVAVAPAGYVLTGSWVDLSSTNRTGAWLARIDEQGAMVWQKAFVGIGSGTSVVGTPDGGFVLAARPSAFQAPGTLTKVDSAGAFLWQRNVSGFASTLDVPIIRLDVNGHLLLAVSSTLLEIDHASGTVLRGKTFGGNFRELHPGGSGFIAAGTIGDPVSPQSWWLAKLDVRGNGGCIASDPWGDAPPMPDHVPTVEDAAAAAQNYPGQFISFDAPAPQLQTSDVQLCPGPEWDAFWRRSDGLNAAWRVGASIDQRATSFLPGVATDWTVIATGDVNRDGVTDVVWMHPSTGTVAIWLMAGAGTIASTAFPATLGAASSWVLGGIADVNGDGRGDLVWRNATTGELLVWYMRPDGTIEATQSYGAVPAAYDLVGLGDFDGDGVTDLLWYDGVHDIVVQWLMHTDGTFSAAFPGAAGGAGWSIAAVGDVDGDGKADILWWDRTTAATALWYMNGGAIAASDVLPSVQSSEYTFGTLLPTGISSDIVWYSPAAVVRWKLARHQPVTSEFSSGVGAEWHMMPKDMGSLH